MNDFLTWSYVATFAGMVFSTSLVVQFFKELPYIKNLPTRYFTCIVAVILLTLSTFFTGTFMFNNIPLILLNGILITYTATGGNDFHKKTVKIIEDKDENQVVENKIVTKIDETKIEK